MLKIELEKIVQEKTKEVEKLKNLITEACHEAFEELDPCEEGVDFINSVLKRAGLPELTQTIEITIEMEAPLSVIDSLKNYDRSSAVRLIINSEEFYDFNSLSVERIY